MDFERSKCELLETLRQHDATPYDIALRMTSDTLQNIEGKTNGNYHS